MNDNAVFKAMRRWIFYILAPVIGWAAFLGLISGMPVLVGAMTWEMSIRVTLSQWVPWVLLSPLIFWFVLRFPLEKFALNWRVFFHLLGGFLAVVLVTYVNHYYLRPQLTPAFLSERAGMNFGPSPDNQDTNRAGSPPSDRFLPLPRDADQPGPPPRLNREADFGAPFGSSNMNRIDNQRPPPPNGFGQRGPRFWAKVWFDAPIYLILSSISHALVYFRRSQQREHHAMQLKSQLDRAQLQSLRMQLQPHFLFNTLNAISTLVQTNPKIAREMIGSLGQMLRLSLDSDSEVEVPLEQELKFLDSYLEIAQIRFGDRLKLERCISPETLGAFVPTFILQPLAENALKHGIEPSSTAGTIEIRAERSGNQLILSIGDTGIGLTDAPGGAAPDGIGLANTKARLQSLYPGKHQFSIRNRTSGGCIAVLEIPFHTLPASTESEAT